MAIKTDLKQRRAISTKQGRDQASSKGLEYFECSAVSINFTCLFYAGFVLSLEFLKKSWNLLSNFPDLEKVWKIEIKSGKNGRNSYVFFIQSYTKCFISEFISFWSDLIQSRPYVCPAPRKKLCSRVF